MTSNVYAVVGVSKDNGKFKVRWANDMLRIKILAKNGHTDIQLFELPKAMNKLDATKHLLTVGLEGEALTAVHNELAKREGSTVTAEQVASVAA